MNKRLKLILIAFSCLLAFNGFSQEKEIKAARGYEKIGQFSTALQYYKKAEAREKYLPEEERVNLYKSLISCSYKLNNFKGIDKYFDKIELLQPLSDSLAIKYSEFLRTAGNYVKAEKVFRTLANKQTDIVLKKTMLSTLEWYNKNNLIKQPYIISKTNINVQGLSMGVEEYKDGLIIGMPKTTDGTTYYNLGYCTLKDSVHFSEATLLSKNLTSKFYEGYPSLDKVNNILYFTSNSLSKVKIKQGGKKDLGNGNPINALKIYQSLWDGTDWSNKEELSINGVGYNCLHPSVSEDGKTMYFTSNMSGGIGGYDLYKTTKTGANWSTPENLGSKINSLGDEINPYIIGDVLYFSSRGFFGYGGSDVFKIKLTDPKSTVQNIGAPVNTSQDDFSFRINAKDKGYLSSNRGSKKEDLIYSFVYYPVNVIKDAENGKVVEDIDVTITQLINGEWKEVSAQRSNKAGEWKFDFKDGVDYKIKFDNSYRNSKEYTLTADGDRGKELEQLKSVDLQRIFIDGYVIDEETQKGIEGVKEILYEENELGNLEEIDSTYTDEEGYWRFDVEKDKIYEVEIQRVDYELEKIEIEPIVDNEPKRASYTTKLKIKLNKDNEKVLDAENIIFELNSANITKESYLVLNQVITYLKANPYSKLEINAYTDCSGKDDLNMILSNKRAEACAQYIIKEIGGKAFRVKHKGYGETNSLNPCEEQLADPKIAELNRRVEFKLVK